MVLRLVSCSFRQNTDKMPKLTETFASKLPPAMSGTEKHWDSEVKGLVLFFNQKYSVFLVAWKSFTPFSLKTIDRDLRQETKL